MTDSKYGLVVVIGYGTVTGNVLKKVAECSSTFDYSVEYIEHEAHMFNTAKSFAEASGIKVLNLYSKEDVHKHFVSIFGQRTLIISASNNYLFPKDIVSREEFTIINFHNALLPDFPGRNAPTWVIYNKCKTSGITWHYVTEDLDAGDIIIQKSCDINDDIKAYELASKLMELAYEAFSECFPDVLCNKAVAFRQTVKKDRRIYRSSEIPANGTFDLNDDPEEIYRLLRATDYGKNDIFPAVSTEIDGKKVIIKRYKKMLRSEAEEKDNRIFLPLDEEHVLMLKYDVVSE